MAPGPTERLLVVSTGSIFLGHVDIAAAVVVPARRCLLVALLQRQTLLGQGLLRLLAFLGVERIVGYYLLHFVQRHCIVVLGFLGDLRPSGNPLRTALPLRGLGLVLGESHRPLKGGDGVLVLGS